MERSTQLIDRLQTGAAWRRIEEEFLSTGRADQVLEGLTEATDGIAREAYRATIQRVCPESAVMLAVGAYGRRETFPFSGADLVLLLDREFQPEPVKSAFADFARLLWDAGLRLNYTVRHFAECIDVREQNLDLAASLLDRRLLAGDAALHARLESRLPAVLSKHSRDLRQYIAAAARSRHSRFRNTARYLEPDVKESPGGLRDLRLIDWLTRLNPEQQDTDPQLKSARERIAAVRCFLHYQAGRDSNLFDRAAQEAIARAPFASGREPRGAMRDYFRAANLVFREARHVLEASERGHHSLLESFRDYRSRLSNGEFTVTRDRVFLRNPSQLDSDPEIVLRLAEFVARHGVAPAYETERRLESARGPFRNWCAARRPLWPELKIILAAPHCGLALRTLEENRLLGALFPEWEAIEDLPLSGPEHRHTADEHTLIAVQNVADVAASQDASLKRFAELLSEIDNRAVLLFTLLFGEIGSEGAGAAMERIGVPAAERETVEFLLSHDGALAEAITRDMEDPATARLLADRVGTVEHLKMLVMMMYAHSAANPDSMTEWRVEQLWRTYSVTQHELTRELETERIQQVPAELSERAEFIKGFPVRYLRARPHGEIEMHMRLFDQSRPTGVAVELDRVEAAYRITIVARDRPYLFASFAGAISSFGLDIVKAEAFSNSKGVVLDTFVFADPRRLLQLNPSEVERLEDLIQRVALGKTDARRFMRNTPPPDARKRAAPPQVSFDSNSCETATLVEIIAEDRPGLLYSLATVFSSHACNIDVVLIDTKGHRAIDVFYVAYEGRKLDPGLQDILRGQLLAVC